MTSARTASPSGADFTVPYLEGWEGTAFYTFGQTKNDIANQDFSFSAVEQGLNCDVITDVESCFNPFGAIDRAFETHSRSLTLSSRNTEKEILTSCTPLT